MSISIKISEENYRKLNSLSGTLREKFGKPISINDAITHLSRKMNVSDLAGSWKMNDAEAKDFTNNLRRGWSKWKIKSA